MSRAALPLACVAPLLLLAACARDVTGPEVAVSVALDPLPFPAVAASDTLRDSAGVVSPVTAQAYNFRGEPVPGAEFRYFTLDRGVTVDSLTGVVRGDSVRDTPVRLFAALGELQTQTRQLSVVQRPDSLAVVTGTDTLRYSVIDTTVNFSASLSVRLFDSAGTPVRSWLISFAIEYPADTLLATLVDEAGRASALDTTAADGLAGRRVRVRPEHLAVEADSVVVFATARYRGLHVRDSPARLVVHLRSRVP